MSAELQTPVCYAAVRDDATRASLTETLRKLGWTVIEKPTGYHLVEQLSEVILGERPARPIGLVVVDDVSPGCRGSTIARGLRELGIDVPVALIADHAPPEAPDERVYVLEPPLAALGVSAIARHQTPERGPRWAAA